MAKLYFRYGAMGSSKSANILMVRYNYEERGQYAVLLKPRTDSRDGERKIQSRMGLSASAEYVDEFLKEISTIWKKENTEYRYQGKKVDAVRIMKTSYGIDMEADGQYSKLIRDIPTPDIVISMGCNVGCPFIDRPFDDNWGLEDPTGKNDEAFKLVIEEIRKKILELKKNAS